MFIINVIVYKFYNTWRIVSIIGNRLRNLILPYTKSSQVQLLYYSYYYIIIIIILFTRFIPSRVPLFSGTLFLFWPYPSCDNGRE